jgi:hypothetical protein
LSVTSSSGDTQTATQSFDVVNAPRVEVSHVDLDAQFGALIGIRDTIFEAHRGVTTIRSLRRQLGGWQERSDMSAGTEGAAGVLMSELDAIEAEPMLPGEHKDTFGLNERSRLNEKLASVVSVIASADTKPTTQSLQVAEVYSGQIEEQLSRLKEVLEGDLVEFNALLKRTDLTAVEQEV